MNGLIFVFMFIGAVICATTASSKQRNVVGWMIGGALFPLICVIAVLCLPSLAPPEETSPGY